MLAPIEVGETELPERMPARLRPRPEPSPRVVALGVETDGALEVVDVEGHAAEEVRQAREIQLVAGGFRIFEEALVARQGGLVVAARERGVAQVVEGDADQISGMLSAGEVQRLGEIVDGQVVVAVPFEMSAGDGGTLREETRIARGANQAHRPRGG